MVGIDNNYQHIDWGHPEIDGENADYEDGDGNHLGTLSAKIVSPGITIGLSNYWNMTISQVLGVRSMTWGKEWDSDHHRDEDSSSNFDNAVGGLLGDSRIMFRYLFLKDGVGPGTRFFFGLGIVMPSKNTLTSDPFFLNDEEKEEHRHFSLSNGVYKTSLESQIFYKQNKNPMFMGSVFSIDIPIEKNEFGYKPGLSYSLVSTFVLGSHCCILRRIAHLTSAVAAPIPGVLYCFLDIFAIVVVLLCLCLVFLNLFLSSTSAILLNPAI